MFFDQRYGQFMPSPSHDWMELAKNIKTFTGLASPVSVLDQGCGRGELCQAFAQQGDYVVGIDEAPYVGEAASHPHTRFFQTAAESYVKSVDLVVCWHTSFGFGKEPSLHENHLRNAALSLQKGGVFCLDLGHNDRLLKNFMPIFEQDFADLHIVRHSRLDGRVLYQIWEFSPKNGEKPWTSQSCMTVYTKDEIVGLLKKVGFSTVQVFSTLAFDPLTTNSSRMIFRSCTE